MGNEGFQNSRSAIDRVRIYTPSVPLARPQVWLHVVAVSLLSGIALIFYFFDLVSPLLMWLYIGAAGLGTVGVAGGLLYTSITRALESKRVAAVIIEAVEEIESNANRLNDYLENLDRRTSRYFNTVTQTNRTHGYFMLRSLEGSLRLLLEDVRKLVSVVSPENLENALSILRGQLPMNEAMAWVTTSKLPSPMIHEVPKVITLLIKDLEAYLEEIEEEVSHYRTLAEENAGAEDSAE